MDIESRHSELRQRLDHLGFGHPLPLSAIGIVSAILDDLIQTAEKLKAANHQIEQLYQEKAAWELGVEPYKCDNSRLLAECNELHLELIKQQDKHILANTELRSRVRSLQAEKKVLEEKCLQAEGRVRELQANGGATGSSSDCAKSRKDSVNKQRKPFISTVRGGGTYPASSCCEQQQKSAHPGQVGTSGMGEMRCRCPCNQVKQVDAVHEVERLKVETLNQQGVIDALQKQINFRDREIQRLGALFSGGRPAEALAKDCCYRGVDVLGQDVDTLQQEKLSLQRKLDEAQTAHERMSRKLGKMSEKNQQLEKELREMENVALKVESEANLNILEQSRQNSDLQAKLQQWQMRVKELESLLELCSGTSRVQLQTDSSTTSSSCPSVAPLDTALHNALKQATEEKRQLYKQLNELKDREHSLRSDHEKVKAKYTKLKQKYSILEATQSRTNVVTDIESQAELRSLKDQCEDLEMKLRKVKEERDRYNSESERQQRLLKELKRESSDKELELTQLKSELQLQRKLVKSSSSNVALCSGRIKTADSIASGQSSLSVQAAIHRIERERDESKCEVQRLEQERDALRDKLKLSTRSQREEMAKHENLILGYSAQVAKLEGEKRDLLLSKSSSQTKLQLIKEENRELQDRLKEQEDSYHKLKVSYSQLKILQEQTERSLTQHQNRLMSSETQLGTTEAKLHRVDSAVEDVQKEMGSLRGEISVLKASNVALEREKDQLLIELDKKTEKLFAIESEMASLKAKRNELQSTIDRMQHKLENVSTDNIQKESTLRSVSTETDTLKKQLSTLKRSNDNASTENGRLSNELTDALAELTMTKRKLKDSQQEVEGMKSQLREYVQEIRRAEELLLAKEREREDILKQYKSLSEGANTLEASNQTLEMESMEAKKLLQEAEDRISGLEELVTIREQDIRECERQINELSAQLAAAESELEALRDNNHALSLDLEATKELCSKLDLQKDKLSEELQEHSNIREQLAREKETMQKELSLARTGDRAAVKGLQELLAASRAEVEQQRIVLAQREQERDKLVTETDALRARLAEQQEAVRRSEALASEYSVQLQELRRKLTDDRFALIRSRNADPSDIEPSEVDVEDDDDEQNRYSTM
ncbi:centrosomal protein of 135 kDa [Anopheles aquasalis]|uniref:centrosomal protein of 135 kDa n=1 Tax=Anopheles aquasalis TaxID=42839 RepID=UPI00215B156B|nr:centrosomal protein of 135 kDa [Anopheles aquasalis]